MPEEGQTPFGNLLRITREAAGLSRQALSRRVRLDPAHIYRLEKGVRKPSRGSVRALAEALGVRDDERNEWLLAANYAPLRSLRTDRQTRGADSRSKLMESPPSDWDAAHWKQWCEAMGLSETMIERLLHVMGTAKPSEQRAVKEVLSVTFSRMADVLEAPVRTAVIPAAGEQHRFLAPQIIQRLLIRSISEASQSAVTRIILVLAPGTWDSLYSPLKDALDLAIVPSIELEYVEQTRAAGLGDALLAAQKQIGDAPFVVLLPNEIVIERPGQLGSQELRRGLDKFDELEDAQLVAVAPVSKSKMHLYGIAEVGTEGTLGGFFPVTRLVEKPDTTDPIRHVDCASALVGRYWLRPSIFASLEKLAKRRKRPLQLTDALEDFRKTSGSVYAFHFDAKLQDIDEVLERATGLIAAGHHAYQS